MGEKGKAEHLIEIVEKCQLRKDMGSIRLFLVASSFFVPEVIDDFAKRLSDFVINAGNTLYKGISEILDRTMRERKERAGDVSELKVGTSAQIEQVRAATRALAQLREGLWSGETEEAPTNT